MKRISLERFSCKDWGNYHLLKESEYYYQSKQKVYLSGMCSYAYEIVFYQNVSKKMFINGFGQCINKYFVRVNYGFNGYDFGKSKDFTDYKEFIMFIKLLNNIYEDYVTN